MSITNQTKNERTKTTKLNGNTSASSMLVRFITKAFPVLAQTRRIQMWDNTKPKHPTTQITFKKKNNSTWNKSNIKYQVTLRYPRISYSFSLLVTCYEGTCGRWSARRGRTLQLCASRGLRTSPIPWPSPYIHDRGHSIFPCSRLAYGCCPVLKHLS